jgi:hypothetical protein
MADLDRQEGGMSEVCTETYFVDDGDGHQDEMTCGSAPVFADGKCEQHTAAPATQAADVAAFLVKAEADRPITRAWVRARTALQMAYRSGAPLPSVRIFPDGSAEFIFPGRLAQLLKGDAADLTALIGSNRLSIASTVAEDPDSVSVRVPGEVLGREKD